MTVDKKKLYTVALSYLVAILLVCLVPNVHTARWCLALLSAAFAVIAFSCIKKKSILSSQYRQVTLLMLVIAALSIMLYFLTGLFFGFSTNALPYRFVIRYLVPMALILPASELIRRILTAQGDRFISAVSFAAAVLSDVLMLTKGSIWENHAGFMSLVGLVLFPAISANTLYHFLSVRYGVFPNLIYRIALVLYPFAPVSSNIPDSLLSFIRVVLPLLIMLFIGSLYATQKGTVKKARVRMGYFFTALVLILMLLCVMLISCRFRYGLIVIASESMTGSIDKGDAIVYETYDGESLSVGQVIMFDKHNTTFVHRIVDIQRINGELRYITRGDANDHDDEGYLVSSQVKGIVLFEIKYVGYPTLWLRNVFA